MPLSAEWDTSVCCLTCSISLTSASSGLTKMAEDLHSKDSIVWEDVDDCLRIITDALEDDILGTEIKKK